MTVLERVAKIRNLLQPIQCLLDDPMVVMPIEVDEDITTALTGIKKELDALVEENKHVEKQEEA